MQYNDRNAPSAPFGSTMFAIAGFVQMATIGEEQPRPVKPARRPSRLLSAKIDHLVRRAPLFEPSPRVQPRTVGGTLGALAGFVRTATLSGS